jgi:asparagine synthase (glutamine-hydrolysing)
MCGIAGMAGVFDLEALRSMCDAIVHRGPNSNGVWFDETVPVALGHRRLSIIDLTSAGHQPMVSDDRQIVLSYNGEIYNFAEHRAELISAGVSFRSSSDTEVVLRLYERHGLDFLSKLNGMFALAIWDGREQQLILARDHAGIKPLYFMRVGPGLVFASEAKALLAYPGVQRRVNACALGSYLSFLWVPGDQTMFDGISKLEPGRFLLWRNGRIDIRRWFKIAYEPGPSQSSEAWADAVRETFVRVTRRQMVSDVPLGAFLSGGLDSSAIVACMRRAFPDRPITAYSARYRPGEMAEEQGVDDYPYAERVARHLDVNLRPIDIQPDVVRLLPRMVHALDEPDADPAIFPSYLIAQAARADGCTVMLSGTGGDEVFFGYRSHQALRHYEAIGDLGRLPAIGVARAAALGLGVVFGQQHRSVRRLKKFLRGLAARPGSERHFALVDWADPDSRRSLLVPDVANATGVDHDALAILERYSAEFEGHGAINRHSYLLVNTFLAAHNFLYTDKSSMLSSVEVRVPFMDLELMRLAASIPEYLQLRGGVAKNVLKEAMTPWLPADVIHRSKTGFGVPLRRWLRTDLDELVQGLLSPSVVSARGLMDPTAVQRIIADNASGKSDHGYLIYALLVLEVWMQTFVDRPGVAVQL